jgi:hypothetical protein
LLYARALRSVLACVAVLMVMSPASIDVARAEDEPSFFDFSVDDADGNAVALRSFAHQKAILVVNVASACGYTDQNYKELQVRHFLLYACLLRHHFHDW